MALLKTLPRVAVLYQALTPPVFNGVQKPKKPGGYQDSGADIAYVLKHKCNIPIVTPKQSPDASVDGDWVFPDDEQGIVQALRQGATHLWANTILFSSHPLQTSKLLDQYQDDIKVVGQPPNLVEAYDDKAVMYQMMKSEGGFTLAKSVTMDAKEDENVEQKLNSRSFSFPLIAKPVRGRSSHGVRLCLGVEDLEEHIQYLFKESSQIIIEEYLRGDEATVTVMPPSSSKEDYWALPVVTRFNHKSGIAPYNGVVAVTANSRAVPMSEVSSTTSHYQEAMRECERVATMLQCKAPIRVDVRQFRPGSKFALFDVNMKPNMTGPGRPGREDQASLTAMAAGASGWSYGDLLKHVLSSASTLRELRETKMEEM